ncbi:MAG: TIGR02300 family protein [Parvibaculum sp.]|uniref:TIGR02300 family protein n=1 Tax=Parvibaculum sp. TaxID=2024848 RepID=UPI0027281C52|nr:TIGR02300 family protein [Parvibaculum sp.]MDO8839233.1 TIGR02300 family protein [Parvibaculum sp.]
MSKPELGTKRDCPSCGAKFYDLNKNPVVCPKCKHEYVPDTGTKAKRAKPVEKPKEKPLKRVVVDDGDTVSLDAMRDEELAVDDDDIDVDVDVEVEDDDADDAFLPDDEDEDDDVTGIVRGGKGDDD